MKPEIKTKLEGERRAKGIKSLIADEAYRRRRLNDMYIEREMINSEAMKALGRNGTAVRALLLFLDKKVVRKLSGAAAKNRSTGKNSFEIVNNGKIEFRYTEAIERLGIKSDTTFTNTLDALIRVGFIDITSTGMGVKMHQTLYAISDRWRKYGTPEFIEKKRDKRKSGHGFQKGNKLAKRKPHDQRRESA